MLKSSEGRQEQNDLVATSSALQKPPRVERVEDSFRPLFFWGLCCLLVLARIAWKKIRSAVARADSTPPKAPRPVLLLHGTQPVSLYKHGRSYGR